MHFATTHTTNQLHAFSAYRFHFNGKEADNEVYGEGNVYDYGFRIYNPRLGKFLSVDPLTKSFPWYSPFHFAGNKPIGSIDIDGREDIYYMKSFLEKQGGAVIKIVDKTELGNQFINEFTDPQKNKGYDLFVRAIQLSGLPAQNGGKGKQGNTNIIFDSESEMMIESTREIVNVYEAIKTIRLNKENGIENEGELYQNILNALGEEVLFSEGLGETISKNRTIIIMNINSIPLDEISSTDATISKSNLRQSAKVFGHELKAHANRMMTGKKQSPRMDHIDYQNIDIEGVNLEGSMGDRFDKQVDTATE